MSTVFNPPSDIFPDGVSFFVQGRFEDTDGTVSYTGIALGVTGESQPRQDWMRARAREMPLIPSTITTFNNQYLGVTASTIIYRSGTQSITIPAGWIAGYQRSYSTVVGAYLTAGPPGPSRVLSTAFRSNTGSAAAIFTPISETPVVVNARSDANSSPPTYNRFDNEIKVFLSGGGLTTAADLINSVFLVGYSASSVSADVAEYSVTFSGITTLATTTRGIGVSGSSSVTPIREEGAAILTNNNTELVLRGITGVVSGQANTRPTLGTGSGGGAINGIQSSTASNIATLFMDTTNPPTSNFTVTRNGYTTTTIGFTGPTDPLAINEARLENNQRRIVIRLNRAAVAGQITGFSLAGFQAPAQSVIDAAITASGVTLTDIDEDEFQIDNFDPGVIRINPDFPLRVVLTLSDNSRISAALSGYSELINTSPLEATLNVATRLLTVEFNPTPGFSLSVNSLERFAQRLVYSSTEVEFFGVGSPSIGPNTSLASLANPSSGLVDQTTLSWTLPESAIGALVYWAENNPNPDVANLRIRQVGDVIPDYTGGVGIDATRFPLTIEGVSLIPELCQFNADGDVTGVKVNDVFPPNASQDDINAALGDLLGTTVTFSAGLYTLAAPITLASFLLLGYPNLFHFTGGGDLELASQTVQPRILDGISWTAFELAQQRGLSREDGRGLSYTEVDNRDSRWEVNATAVMLADSTLNPLLGRLLQAYSENKPIAFKLPSEVLETGDDFDSVTTIAANASRGSSRVQLSSTSEVTVGDLVQFSIIADDTQVSDTSLTKIHTVVDVDGDDIVIEPTLLNDISTSDNIVKGTDVRFVMAIADGSLSIEKIPNNDEYVLISLELQEVL